MKSTVLFLSGMTAMLAGAFIRSCQPAIPDELLVSFCGPTPHDALAAFHAHCAGCVTMLAGAAAILTAPLLPVIQKRKVQAK